MLDGDVTEFTAKRSGEMWASSSFARSRSTDTRHDKSPIKKIADDYQNMYRHNHGQLNLNTDKRSAVPVSMTASPRSGTSCAGAAPRRSRARSPRRRRQKYLVVAEARMARTSLFFTAEASVSQSSSHYPHQNSQIYFHVECQITQLDVPLDTRCLEAICVGPSQGGWSEQV